MINETAKEVQVPRFTGNGKIEMGTQAVADPGPGQLLIQVKANALCGSELPQFFNGSDVTPGHEAAGIVVAAGTGTQTPVGTPGVVFLMDFCGECRSCKLGFTNQCLNKRADMGFNKDGGYGVFELVNENIFFSVPAELPMTEATLLLDIMGTGGHAIARGQVVHPDIQSVLVAGAGPIGLGVAAMVRILLGEQTPVFITDMVRYRLDLAEQLGALPINLSTSSISDGLRFHGFDSADLAIDTSGKGVARQGCLDVLAQRGVLVCVGHGEGLEVKVSPQLIATERAILGSEYFAFSELSTNLGLLRTHQSYLSQIITHRFGIDEIQHAFELFFGAGETGKVIIEQ